MAMATQSLTTTIFATRAGTRILMRAGDDDGARSLRRRRWRGGVVATAQRSRHKGGGVVLETPRARRGAQALERGRAEFGRRARWKFHHQEGRDGGVGDRRRRAAAPLVRRAPRATTFPMMPPRGGFARLVA